MKFLSVFKAEVRAGAEAVITKWPRIVQMFQEKSIRMFTFERSNEFTSLLGVHIGVHKGVQIGVQIGGPDWGSRFCGYPFLSHFTLTTGISGKI